MPRMMRRAAVLGATAHVASSRGAAKGAAAAQEQAAAPPAAAPPAAAPVPVPEAASGAGTQDSYAELVRLKELLDAGVLTQAEFDLEKQKVLNA